MRKQTTKILMLLVALLAAASVAACGSAADTAPTAAPTQDLNILRTEVAATVLAQVPQICALTPTATLQPTITPMPSPTSEVTATDALALTPAAGTPAAGTPAAGTPGATTGDQAKWVSQSIQDGTRFVAGETFTMVWRLQNVGKTTWTDGYRLRFFSGDPFGAPREISLDRDVAPNETVDITIEMKAPARNGKYRSDWVMSNETLYNFNEPVYLEIVVGNPPTATVTPTVLTPTATPQELLPTATATP
jgi:hypothetical protein